jgi:hypothetical protein
MAVWGRSAQDGGVASEDEYEWADDPALSPDVIRARPVHAEGDHCNLA